MKKIFTLSLFCLYAAFFAGCKGQPEQDEHGHIHQEGEACTGDHDHSQEAPTHNHPEGETCGDDNSPEAPTHNHTEGETCGDEHDHAGENHDGYDHGLEAAGEEDPDMIVFTDEQAARGEFEVCPVQKGMFYNVFRTSGQILPTNAGEATVTATSSGIVSFGSSSIIDGGKVSKGQTLFVLASRNLADGDYYTRVKAEYEFAQAEYQRAERLSKDAIISKKDFQQIKLKYENAKAAFDALSGNSTGKGLRVTSPVAGFVRNIYVKQGQYVQTGEPLATVVTDNRLMLRAEVSEKYYRQLPGITSANFKTPYDDRVYDLSGLSGKLLSIGKTSPDASYFIPVTFEFENRDNIPAGSFVEVFLKSAPLPGVISVPVGALMETEGANYVFLSLGNGHYRKQEVRTGANNGIDVEILSGLSAGEQVVCKGAYRVKIASNSSAIPHGHEH